MACAAPRHPLRHRQARAVRVLHQPLTGAPPACGGGVGLLQGPAAFGLVACSTCQFWLHMPKALCSMRRAAPAHPRCRLPAPSTDAQKVKATFLVSGWTRGVGEGEGQQHVVRVVDGARLEAAQAGLGAITCMHVYSVQPGVPKVRESWGAGGPCPEIWWTSARHVMQIIRPWTDVLVPGLRHAATQQKPRAGCELLPHAHNQVLMMMHCRTLPTSTTQTMSRAQSSSAPCWPRALAAATTCWPATCWARCAARAPSAMQHSLRAGPRPLQRRPLWLRRLRQQQRQ